MEHANIYLCKADCSLLGTISGIKTETCQLTKNAVNFWELTFEIERYTNDNGKLIQSNYYDSIDDMMKLYIDGKDIYKKLSCGLKRCFFEYEYRCGSPYYHAQNDGRACDGVGGKQIEIRVEYVVSVSQYAHGQSSESLVGIYTRNHWQQCRKQVSLGGSLGQR